MPSPPKRGGDALIEHPTNREVNGTLAEAFPGKPVEPLNGGKILPEAGRLEFRIGASQVVTFKDRLRLHASGKKASTQRAIAERRDIVLAAVRQDVGLDPALKQIVGRLQHVKR